MLGINLKKLQKEDPEKVRAFLKDLCECEEIPLAGRKAVAKLLRRYEAKQNLKSGIKAECKDMLNTLKKGAEDV